MGTTVRRQYFLDFMNHTITHIFSFKVLCFPCLVNRGNICSGSSKKGKSYEICKFQLYAGYYPCNVSLLIKIISETNTNHFYLFLEFFFFQKNFGLM